MSLYGLIIIACGLAMVSFTMAFLGSFYRCQDLPGTVKIAFFQGAFQGGLFSLGWLISLPFRGWIGQMAWPLAIFIMVMLGLKMVLLSRKAKPPEKAFDLSQFRILIGASIASGINAFIAGMALGLINVQLYPAVLVMALASLVFSIIGVIMGKVSGNIKFSQVAEALGGFFIIFTGIMLFLEYTNMT